MTGQTTERAHAHAEAQRRRILHAAQRCFVEHGFHCANMAGIARAAEMSPGLIYRYFASKHDIILAIIERQLELSRAEIAELRNAADLPQAIWTAIYGPAGRRDRMNASLHADISAEAARDDQIGAAVAESDRILREEFGQWLARPVGDGGLGLPARQAEDVGVLVQCLVDGLRLRHLREPDLDGELVQRALRDLLRPWLVVDDR